MGDEEAGEEVLGLAVFVHADADLHIAAVLFLDGDETLLGVIIIAQEEVDALIEVFPRVGERDRVGVAVEQPHLQLVLQRGDVLADGGL